MSKPKSTGAELAERRRKSAAALAEFNARKEVEKRDPKDERIAELEEALDTSIALLWEHVPGIAPRIEAIESVREGSEK